MAVRRGGATALAPARTAVKARHLDVRRRFVDEDDPRRVEVELTSPRCDVAACAVFFARDLATFEEPPQRSDADADVVFFQPVPRSSAKMMSDFSTKAERIRSAWASIRRDVRSPP